MVSDVLTIEDHLYQGIVKDYFLSSDGELTGIFLGSPFRFRRKEYDAQKERDPSTKVEDFWVPVPGHNLYVPKEKILNLNLLYPPAGYKLPGNATKAESEAATIQFKHEGVDYTIIPEGRANPDQRADSTTADADDAAGESKKSTKH